MRHYVALCTTLVGNGGYEMRAIGYCRVSTQEQGESGAGLESQEALIRSDVTRRGWELAGIYTDVASGKSMRKRPQMATALGELKAGRADALVVGKLDRLSRSVIDFARLMEVAQSEGWSLVVLDLAVDTTTTNGKLIAHIMIALAQWERELIGDRTKSALTAIRARGTKLGRPSGVDANTIKFIGVMRLGGLSWQKIADALTEAGVPTAQGGRWHGATVRKLAA